MFPPNKTQDSAKSQASPQAAWPAAPGAKAAVQPLRPVNALHKAKVAPSRLTAGEVAQLQCTLGNRAVGQLLNQTPPKPESGAKSASNPRPTPTTQGQPVIQRVLEITDTQQYFEQKSDAEAYLAAEYVQVLTKDTPSGTAVREMTSDETVRMQEIAAVADEARYVYPVATLEEALQYIATGLAINSARYDLRPDQTPARETDDSTPWNFVLHKSYTPPAQFEIPQSPAYESYFPSDSTYNPEYEDLRSGITEVRSQIDSWQADIPKTHKGNNHYAYQLKIKYRLDRLRGFTDVQGGTSYTPRSRSALYGASQSSRYYTSKKKLPPQKKGDSPHDVEPAIRDTLTHLHSHYDRDAFQKTSLYATDKAGVRTKTPQFYQTAKVGQISSLYFHSEVQAASDADGARLVAQQAVAQVVQKALSDKKAGPYNLVITAGIIEGYSDNRTVCGNACKPALAYLSEIIAAEMAAQLRLQRDMALVKASELFIRRSRYFRVSAHVGAGVEFQGLETGAQLGTSQPTVLPHHGVHEYKPLS